MLPKDPIILLSYVNTKLRGEFSSLYDFCTCMDVCEDDIIDTLRAAGYRYSEEQNRFI